MFKIPKKDKPVYKVKLQLSKSWQGKKTDTIETTKPKNWKKGKKIKWEHGLTATIIKVTKTKKMVRLHTI